MTPRRGFGFVVLAVVLFSVFLLPGCVRFDGVVDFEADLLSGKKPLAVQFTLLVHGCIDGCLWSFGDGTFSRDRNPVHTYEQAGNYTVILTVTPCQAEPVSIRKDGYITVTSGFGATSPTMWCYFADNAGHRVRRSEFVPPFEGGDPGMNEELNHTIGMPNHFALLGPILFWTEPAKSKIFAADVTPGRPDNVLTAVDCEKVPHGLAIDPLSLNAYWTEYDPEREPPRYSIMRANIDNGAEPELFEIIHLKPVEDLAFDDVERNLYWVGFLPEIHLVPFSAVPQAVNEYVIARAGVALDGTVVANSWAQVVSEPGRVTDIAIDPEGRKLYWYNADVDEIKRASLDGSGVETIVSDVPGVSDLAVDEQNRRIVWVSNSYSAPSGVEIVSAALDGSDIRYRFREVIPLHSQVIAIGPRPPWTPADLGD